ncbi:MAG TPA: DNA/RNA non-specific endonuclease [Fimbriimonas sp.]|nr:DNA/RNA non-specific endonuclease [Fimbriimonas sp.]
MFSESKLEQLSVKALDRFQTKVGGFDKKKARKAFAALAGADLAPEPTPGDIYRANTTARDRCRALIAEASATTDAGSQSETIKTLSQERVLGTPDFLNVDFLEFAIAVSRGVARINLVDGFGTGSLVGPRLLLTNNHVIESKPDARTAVAEFDYQDDANGDRLQKQTFECDPDTFFYTNAALDFTVVALKEVSTIGTPLSNYPWTRLNGTPGKTSKGLPINIIQHPKGGLKQIVFRNNQVIEIPEGKPDFLYYTTDTEPGSSGSPCFTDSWDMVALHHAGVPILDAQNKIIGWQANEGVRVSAMVAKLLADVVDPREKALLDEMLGTEAPNPIEVARKVSGHRSPIPSALHTTTTTVLQPDGSAVWTIPLTVQVSVGAPLVGGGNLQPQVRVVDSNVQPDANALEGLKIDPFTKKRSGYDEIFLGWGQPIPLPTLTDDQLKDTVEVPVEHRGNHGPHVLDYYYYSVAMCKSRKFAWYSVANIDGDNRPTVPKRSGDKWSIDARIEPDPKNPIHQLGEELYATDKTDRGHLTRYLDLAWGDTPEQALAAMADTFHFTNCTLQLSVFNQGKSRWQGLEQFLLENHARKQKRRIVVMTGPVFKPNDLQYKNEFMTEKVRLPVSFWKVCVIVRQDGSLSVTGFIMGQSDLADLPGVTTEAFDVIATQVTLAELELETGLSFGFLKNHDHFAKNNAPGTIEVMRESTKMLRKPLVKASDIVV